MYQKDKSVALLDYGGGMSQEEEEYSTIFSCVIHTITTICAS